jgi:hypothetical protein
MPRREDGRSDEVRADVEQRRLDESPAEQERIRLEVRDRAADLEHAIAGGHRQAASVDVMAGLADLEERARRGEGGRFAFSLNDLEVFCRSTTTALAGAAHVAPGMVPSGAGLWFPNEVNAPNMNLAPGTRIESGIYPANAGVAATGEGSTKPVLDPSSLSTATVSPYAVTSSITLQSQLAGQGVAQFTWAATRKVRKSVNDAFTAAMVAAGGTARAFNTSAVVSLDGAIATAMDLCAGVPDLLIVDTTVFSALAQAGGGQLSTAAVPSYRGIRMVPSSQASIAGNAVVLDGSSIAMSLSGVEILTHPQLTNNTIDALCEVWFAVAVRGASGVTYQDCTTP